MTTTTTPPSSSPPPCRRRHHHHNYHNPHNSTTTSATATTTTTAVTPLPPPPPPQLRHHHHRHHNDHHHSTIIITTTTATTMPPPPPPPPPQPARRHAATTITATTMTTTTTPPSSSSSSPSPPPPPPPPPPPQLIVLIRWWRNGGGGGGSGGVVVVVVTWWRWWRRGGGGGSSGGGGGVTVAAVVGKRLEHNYNASVNFSGHHSSASLVSATSTSRTLLASSSDETPISSPLTPVLALGSGKPEEQKVLSKPSKVQAVLQGIKQSPKKVNLVAALVRGMRVEDALLQLQVTVKRASKTVYQVIYSVRANATHNHGLDPDRLLVAEAFVGKGLFLRRESFHGRGRSGVMHKPECRLIVVVREITPEEEAEIAKLKVSNFLKLTKRERRLVPHKLIETTPIWNRKSKATTHG
ncbi:hypothetical protein RHMOL_Rhmol03G0067700 [Rhododendron molle]|uniref:Uncharacterized protein n=1 Tax=Rhododendron molle TaxID=49168 RepID=A0ACC0PDU7_RHOML|nr:hypothetical protein RHMOL_Rhmol03G0067700 [Rhododendron molle]